MAKIQMNKEFNAGAVKVIVHELTKEQFTANRTDERWLFRFDVQKKIAKASEEPDNVMIEGEVKCPRCPCPDDCSMAVSPFIQIVREDGSKWFNKTITPLRKYVGNTTFSVKFPKLLIELLNDVGMKAKAEVLVAFSGNNGCRAFLGVDDKDPAKAKYRLIDIQGDCSGMTLETFKDAITFAETVEKTAEIIRSLPDFGEYSVVHEAPSEVNNNTTTDVKMVVDAIRSARYVALDIETTGLDPLVCELTGMNITTINPAASGETKANLTTYYVPCICSVAGVQCASRTEQEEIYAALRTSKNIFHNAPFDVTVLKHVFGGDYLPIFADTMIYSQKLFCGQWMTFGLKEMYNRIVIEDDGFPALSYKDVFTEDYRVYISFDPRFVARYSGYDSYMTARLFLRLLQWATPTGKEYKRIITDNPYWSEVIRGLITVEMPLLPHVIETCDIGLHIDRNQLEKLCGEYEEKKNIAYAAVQEEFNTNSRIQKWKEDNPDYKFPEELNPRSNPTVKWLFAEIFKVEAESYGKKVIGDKRKIPASAHEISKRILNYRKIALLHKTFLANNLEVIDQPHSDGALHPNLKQCGAATSRFTCSGPNLQNIPSREKIIRSQFSARPGNVFISIDFSAQEPRILANLTRDPKLIQNYLDDRDVYCTLASGLYNVPYEECLEFIVETMVDGKPVFKLDENGQQIENAEGAKRRKRNKIYLLALCYGKGAASLAVDLEAAAYSDWEDECKKAESAGQPLPTKPKAVTTEDAEVLMAAFLKMIPTLDDFKKKSEARSLKVGYVQTLLGHQRYLPDTQLPPHHHIFIDTWAKPRVSYNSWECPSLNRQWQQNGKEFAKQYKIVSTNSLISACRRRVFNTQIQGTAAGQTKLAWLKIATDPEFKRLGGRVALQIHDELLFECPEAVVNEVAKICKYHMETSILDWIPDFAVPVKSDVAVMVHWDNAKMDNLDFTLSFDDEVDEDEAEIVDVRFAVLPENA